MMLLDLLTSSLPFHGHFAWADFFWDHPIFEQNKWERYVRVVRLALALGGGMFLIYEARARKLLEPVRQRTLRRIGYLATFVAFLAYFDFFNPHTRYSEYYHRHEFYHYYLGSKYSSEVGYIRLYECTLIAEWENAAGNEALRKEIRQRELRDLRVNLIKPVTDSYVFSNPGECKDRFTAARWTGFKKDIQWFYESAKGSYWDNMQKDHGYNPPPVWSMTGKFFASFAPASDGFFKLLASLDVMLQLGTVLLLNWAFGWRVMMAGTIFWGVNGAANFYWTGGAFLRQDWTFFFVAALCLARKRYFALSGAALTWSSLLRVFPMLAFIGWFIIIGIDVFRRVQRMLAGDVIPERGIDRWLHRDHQRLLAGCIVAAGTLLPMSVVVIGPDSYVDFFKHTLHTHNTTPLTNHMGLKSIIAHDWDSRMRFGRNDALDDPFQGWKQGRIDRNDNRAPFRNGIILALFGWTAWALRRTKLLWIGMAMSVPLMMCMSELTCYYYSFFLAPAALIRVRPTLGPPYLATAAASFIVLFTYYWVDDKFVAMSYVFLLFSVMMLWAYSRPFSMERLKAWIANRPDPKPEHKPGGPPTELSLTP
jgi:hypothetical protein